MEKENYRPYLYIGLALAALVIIGILIYMLGEPTRLAEASSEFSSERVAGGKEIYNAQCATCHGTNGEGGVGPALNNKNLLKTTPDSLLFSIIRSGVPGTQMPAWSIDFGGPLTDEDVRKAVAYIRAWEPMAPEITPVVFTPDSGRGAALFANACATCHGENGAGSGFAPAVNDATALAAHDDDWYRQLVINGRPARGMPSWGTTLSSEQVDDLIALVGAWRNGEQVQPAFSVTELLGRAVYALQNGDAESAALQVKYALPIATGAAAKELKNAEAQLEGGDDAGALKTLSALRDQWPLGDATAGAEAYAKNCAPCHGVNGEGGVGKALKPNEYVQTETNAQLLAFLEAGRPGTAMAGFKGRLSDEELANIIAFLRTWQPPK